jgi:tRNA pseudouridine synthase 10
MTLHVLASAGTYIKELVHGDLGRTTPSIGGILGTECDILQLDVSNVFESIYECEETSL